MKKTKIICTLGPSTDNLALVEEMIRAGMDLARFNFSHGSHEGHAARIGVCKGGRTGHAAGDDRPLSRRRALRSQCTPARRRPTPGRARHVKRGPGGTGPVRCPLTVTRATRWVRSA